MTVNREHRAIMLDPVSRTAEQELERQRRLDLPAQYVRGVYFAQRVLYDRNPAYRAGRVIKYDGGTDKMGNTHKYFWPVLARHLVRLQVQPQSYIRVRFLNALYRSEGVPLPPDFLREDVHDMYQQVCSDLQCDFLQQLRDEDTLIREEARILERDAGWEPHRALRQAVAKERGMMVNAILRYSLAMQNGFDDLARTYHDRALTQYIFERRFFDQLEICRVPPALRADGAEVVELFRQAVED